MATACSDFQITPLLVLFWSSPIPEKPNLLFICFMLLYVHQEVSNFVCQSFGSGQLVQWVFVASAENSFLLQL